MSGGEDAQMLGVTKETVDQGLARLLSAPKDVQRWDQGVGDPGMGGASAGHRQLFADYRRALQAVVPAAVAEWSDAIAEGAQQVGSRDEAITILWSRSPAGPADKGEVIAVVRRFWLACDALNRRSAAPARVAPEAFCLAWLAAQAGVAGDAVQVLCCMPYWPLALDRDGNWL